MTELIRPDLTFADLGSVKTLKSKYPLKVYHPQSHVTNLTYLPSGSPLKSSLTLLSTITLVRHKSYQLEG